MTRITGVIASGETGRARIFWIGAERLLAQLSRVTVFCGGYGSGKTEVAVNFALALAAVGHRVRLADLDIVNLYFRSREVRDVLRAHGVEVLVPAEPLLRADTPVVPPEVKGAVEESGGFVVLDVGGDPVGARILAGMATSVTETDYSNLFVVNSRRPFTDTAEKTTRLIAEIGRVSGVPVTATVVNSHLIDETTTATIQEGIELARAVEQGSGIGISFVTVEERMLGSFDAAGCGYPVLVLSRLLLKPWEEGGANRK
ncbi:MAG: cobalamin biosynthesis protein CbiA [candidate division WOR-3 bacterium]